MAPSIKEKELKKEVKKALSEIGPIKPWFDENFNAWIFSHPLYPIECEGINEKDVIKKYPKYLEVFIEHRLQGRIDAITEKNTKGKGGVRAGAGRPKGSIKEPTKQIRVPLDIADWIKQPETITCIRHLMNTYQQTRIHYR